MALKWKVPRVLRRRAGLGRRESRANGAAGAGARVARARAGAGASRGGARGAAGITGANGTDLGGATGFDVAAEAPELTPRPLIMLARSSLPASSAELSTSVSDSESSMRTARARGRGLARGSGDASSSSLSFTSSWDLRTKRLFFFRTGAARESSSLSLIASAFSLSADVPSDDATRRGTVGEASKSESRNALWEEAPSRMALIRAKADATSVDSALRSVSAVRLIVARRGVFDGRVWFPSDDSEKKRISRLPVASRENFKGQPLRGDPPRRSRLRGARARRARGFGFFNCFLNVIKSYISGH